MKIIGNFRSTFDDTMDPSRLVTWIFMNRLPLDSRPLEKRFHRLNRKKCYKELSQEVHHNCNNFIVQAKQFFFLYNVSHRSSTCSARWYTAMLHVGRKTPKNLSTLHLRPLDTRIKITHNAALSENYFRCNMKPAVLACKQYTCHWPSEGRCPSLKKLLNYHGITS